MISCTRDSNITGPATYSTGNVKDNILYTFAVSKDRLGIFDTLSMTLTAFNQATTTDTLYLGSNVFTWSLTNVSGEMIASGPKVFDNLIAIVPLKPHQSVILNSLTYSMAGIFGAPIQAGVYHLRCNVGNGLTFQLNLLCGESKNQITDPSGITSPIYPLKVGNKWTFRETFLSSSGTVFGSDTVSQTIVGEEMINGEKWFLLTSTANADQLITARQDGIYLYYTDINSVVLKYKYPAAMGEEYTSGYEEWTGAILTLVTFQMTVDSTNEVVSVPKGKYQCYNYYAPEVLATFGMQTNEVSSQDILLSNVGPVKEIYGNINWELISTNF
jgi:hypothetical protein